LFLALTGMRKGGLVQPWKKKFLLGLLKGGTAANIVRGKGGKGAKELKGSRIVPKGNAWKKSTISSMEGKPSSGEGRGADF